MLLIYRDLQLCFLIKPSNGRGCFLTSGPVVILRRTSILCVHIKSTFSHVQSCLLKTLQLSKVLEEEDLSSAPRIQSKLSLKFVAYCRNHISSEELLTSKLKNIYPFFVDQRYSEVCCSQVKKILFALYFFFLLNFFFLILWISFSFSRLSLLVKVFIKIDNLTGCIVF